VVGGEASIRGPPTAAGTRSRHPGGPLPPRVGVPAGRVSRGPERERQGAADTGDADAVPTDAEIVAALRRKAEKGDAAAARELREWRPVEGQMIQGDGWLELLTPRERQFVRRVIKRALKRAGHPVTPSR
jgi:hypothetical protein